MAKMRCLTFGILAVAVVGLIFLSGCAGQLTAGQQNNQSLQIVFKDVGFPNVKYIQPTIKEVQLKEASKGWVTIWSNYEAHS